MWRRSGLFTLLSYYTNIVSSLEDFSLESITLQDEPYIGLDSATHMIDYLQSVADAIYEKYLLKPKAMIFGEEEAKLHEAGVSCVISGEAFVLPVHHCHRDGEKNCDLCIPAEKNSTIARHHNHLDGRYLGPTHATPCNINMKQAVERDVLPVYLHNLRSYDSHFLVSALEKRHGRCWIIPSNKEKFLAIRVGRVQFLDSLQFTMESMDTLTKSMNKEDFIETKKAFGEHYFLIATCRVWIR